MSDNNNFSLDGLENGESSTLSPTRRNLLLAAGAGVLGLNKISQVGVAQQSTGGYTVEQSGETTYVNAFDRDESVESAFGYSGFTSELRLQKEDVARLFLFDGTGGLSLGTIIDSVESDTGGSFSYEIDGLDGVEWKLKDDSGGDEFGDFPKWSWDDHNTDGGAFSLPDGFEITITPRPNQGRDDPDNSEDQTFTNDGDIEFVHGDFTAYSDSTDSGDRNIIKLSPNKPITIRSVNQPAQDNQETQSGTRITVSDATDGSEATPMEGVAVHLFNPSGIEPALVPGEYSSIEAYLDDLSGQDVLFDESVLELAQTKETDSSGQVSFSSSFRGEYRVLVEPPTSHPGNLRTVSLQPDSGIGDTTDVVLDSITHYGYLVSNNVRGGEYLRPDSSISIQTLANRRIDTVINDIMRPAYGEFVRSFDTEVTGYPTSASDTGEAGQGLKDEPIEVIMTAAGEALEQELINDPGKLLKLGAIVQTLAGELITLGTTLRYIISGWGVARAKQEAYDENLPARVRRYGSPQNFGEISAELNDPGGSQAADLSVQDIEQMSAIESSRSDISDLTTSQVERLRQGSAPENLNHRHILNAFEEFHSLQTNTERTGSPEELFPPELLLTPNGRIFHTAKSESGFESVKAVAESLGDNISSEAASAADGLSAGLTIVALVAFAVATVATGGAAAAAGAVALTTTTYLGVASIGFNSFSNVQEWNTREQIAADHLRTQVDALWDIEDTATAVEELIEWFNDRTDESPLTGEIDGTISFESVGDISGGFANGTGGTLDANESITEGGKKRSRTGGINLKWTNEGTESASYRIVTYGIRNQQDTDTNDPGWEIEPVVNRYPTDSGGVISPGETKRISIEYAIQNTPGKLYQVHMYKCVLFMEGVRVDTVRDLTSLRTPSEGPLNSTEEPSAVVNDNTNRESLSSETTDDSSVAAKSPPAQRSKSGDGTKRYDLNVADQTVRHLESVSEEAFNTQQAAQEYAPTVTTLLEARLSPGETVTATVDLDANIDTAEFLLIAGGTRRPEFQITGENLDSPLQPDRTSVTIGQEESLGRASVTVEASLQEDAGTPTAVFVPVIQTPSRPPLLTLSSNRFSFSMQPGEEVTRQVLLSEGGNQQPAEAVTAELSRLSNSAGDTLPSGAITVDDVPTQIDSGQDATVTLKTTIPDTVSLSDGPTRFNGTLRVSATSAETVEVPISVLILDTDLQHSRVLSADESVSAVRITATQPTDPQSVGENIRSAYQITVRGRGSASLRLPEVLDPSGYTAVRLVDGRYQEINSEEQSTATGITLSPGVHEIIVTEEQNSETSSQPSETPTGGSTETEIFETVDELINRTEKFVDSVVDTVNSIF